MNAVEQFEAERLARIRSYGGPDHALRVAGAAFLQAAYRAHYMYNFTAQGRPVIQLPTDLVGIQELLWQVQPDLVIETGVAHGGSLVSHAACLEAIGHGHVLGIDIDIRTHNRHAIEAHPRSDRITLLEGSSTDPATIAAVRTFASAFQTVFVILDSNHTHDHVLAELRAYAPLVPVGSYCVVLDTIIEDLAPDTFPGRPWGIGNSPRTAIAAYREEDPGLQPDTLVEHKLVLTSAPGGWLRRVAPRPSGEAS